MKCPICNDDLVDIPNPMGTNSICPKNHYHVFEDTVCRKSMIGDPATTQWIFFQFYDDADDFFSKEMRIIEEIMKLRLELRIAEKSSLGTIEVIMD